MQKRVAAVSTRTIHLVMSGYAGDRGGSTSYLQQAMLYDRTDTDPSRVGAAGSRAVCGTVN